MDSDTVSEYSERLSKLLIEQIDWQKVKSVHCFLPIAGDNEPDLRELIKHIINKGTEVYTSNPLTKAIKTLGNIELHSFSLEQDVRFDLIIVPMLAYDPATNHRLGFGGGFYDRLLKSQPRAQKVGVCFKEFSVDDLPTEPHDQPLQKIFAV